MSWVRIDDGFTGNPKVAQLTDAEFRVWMRVLCYCGKAEDPTVDLVTMREVAGLTRQRAQRFVALELLDPMGEAFEVHHWEQYQPKDKTSAERQARWRSRRVTPAVTETVTATVTPLRARANPSRTRPSQAEPDGSALWDALISEVGPVVTKPERGRMAAAVRDLKAAGATADEVVERCRRYRAGWPHLTLTPNALVSNWSRLATLEPPRNGRSATEIARMFDEEEHDASAGRALGRGD